jgi:hypothetical protein
VLATNRLKDVDYSIDCRMYNFSMV